MAAVMVGEVSPPEALLLEAAAAVSSPAVEVAVEEEEGVSRGARGGIPATEEVTEEEEVTLLVPLVTDLLAVEGPPPLELA